MAKVVVIVPTYNRAHTICRAIDSVLAQDAGDPSCLVIDDGSTDGTGELLARYARDPRVTIVRCSVNSGVTAAKNVGLENLPCECTYFGILDSDDALLPGAIRNLLRVYEAGGDYSQVLGWYEDAQTGERTGRSMAAGQVVTYEDAICGRIEGDFWHLARRDVIGDLRFEERACGGESSLWWRLLKRAPAFVAPEVVGICDRSGTDRVSHVAFDTRTAGRKMWAYRATFNAFGEDLRALSPRRYSELRLEEAKWAALAGLRGDSFRAVRDGLRVHLSPWGLRVAAVTLLPVALLRRLYEYRYANHARRMSNPRVPQSAGAIESGLGAGQRPSR